MRIFLMLSLLAVVPTSVHAMQTVGTSEVDVLGTEIDCALEPDRVDCTVCTSDPGSGSLPVSTGGRMGTGVGVAAPKDVLDGPSYGPYTGLFYAPGGC